MSKICPTYLAFSTVTNPATVTMSMGLPAFPQLSWFLHRHFESFIMTGQILPILHKCPFDTYSLTCNFLLPIGTVQKHIPALTQTATNPNHRAVICKVLKTWQLDWHINTLHITSKSHKLYSCTKTPNAQARVWQPPPRHPTLLPNTCFFASLCNATPL